MKNLVTLANRLQFERFAKKLLNEEHQYDPSLPDKKEKLRKQQENAKPYLRWNGDLPLSKPSSFGLRSLVCTKLLFVWA